MVDKRFPEGAIRPDGLPNIPSQAYADYLTDYYDANPMIPRADPVGYVAPAPKPSEVPLSNYGFDLAGDYIRDAGQSFKNAVTGQGVATVLPKMRFYPGGPTGAEYVYGGIADAGLGAINTLLAGVGAGSGFVAEQIPFQSESQEDRFARDAMAGVEFAEQYAAPYLGLFSKLGKASKAMSFDRAANAPVASAATTAPVAPVVGPRITISPNLGSLPIVDAAAAARAAESTNRLKEIMFSPSIKAARNLKQNKGPYEQLKATMIKAGAKPDELEWSGADDFFSGKNVTKEEIVDYLERNDPRLVPNVRRASGVLGTERASMDMREAVDQVMEDEPFINGRILDEREYLADDLTAPDSNYQSPTDLSDEYLEELAVLKGTTADDLRGKEWVYIDENGDAEFFQYSEDALAHQYGSEKRLQEELNIRVRENLEAEYANDPPRFMNQYDVENPNSIDAGDTQHAEYFPEGGTDYTESLFQYTDPTGRIKIDALAGSSHFSEDNAGTIFHTRHADYVNEDGDTVRYVGEIQSDPQQRLSSDNSPMSYDQSLLEEEMIELRTDIKLIEIRAVEDQKLTFEAEFDEFQLARLGYETSIYNLNKDLKNPNSYTSQIFNTLASKVEGEIPSSGELTDAQEELVNAYIQQSGNQFRGGRRWARLKDAQDEVYEYLVGSEVSWVPEDTKKRIFDIAEDAANKQQDLKKDLIELETKAYAGDVAQGIKTLKPGGPFMSSQNKWLDEGLRRSIYDAVKDPDVDYLAFPNDPEAIASVGGQTADTVKAGTVNYYQRDVQNRLKKLLKSFSKDISVDEINIQTEDFGAFSSKGFKITPEFRKAVMEKGIPTYVVPLAVGTGMGYGALDQVGGGNGQSGS